MARKMKDPNETFVTKEKSRSRDILYVINNPNAFCKRGTKDEMKTSDTEFIYSYIRFKGDVT